MGSTIHAEAAAPWPDLSHLPPIEDLIAGHTAPKFVIPETYTVRGLPPTPELQWDGDEPYLAIEGTDGFRITPYRAVEEDYVACERISNHPDVARWSQMRPYPYSRANSLEWFGLQMANQAKAIEVLRADPHAVVENSPVMVIRDSRGRYVGDVGVTREPAGSQTMSIGYALDPAIHGQGVGKRAAGTLLAWAGARMGPNVVFNASAQTVNAPSNHVLMGLGFKFMGVRNDPWPAHTGGGTRETYDWRLCM